MVFRDPSIDTLCAEVLPRDQRAGLKLGVLSDGAISIDMSGQRGAKGGASSQQIEGFIKCLEATRKVVIDNGVRLPLEPVGQVAHRWMREAGPKLRLLPGHDDSALNNLRIGPAAGTKEAVIADWCSQRQAGACVVCDPVDPKADTVEVLVRLRDKAPIEKRKLDGTWPVPPANAQPQPWQIVNKTGERFYYECRK
jgi:hypothetical protein